MEDDGWCSRLLLRLWQGVGPSLNETSTNLSELAHAAAQGNAEAFRQLVEEFTPACYAIAVRILRNEAESQDILQETFLRVWRRLPTLKDGKAVRGWVFQICRNAALDRRRYLARRPQVELERDLASGGVNPESMMAGAQEDAALGRAVARLKEKHRVVLLLRDVDGMSYKDIALALGIAEGTVDSRLHRARKQLEKLLHVEELRDQPIVTTRRAHNEV